MSSALPATDSELATALAALLACRSQGRYARVGALDALIELAPRSGAAARGCLRASLRHLDAMGQGATDIERDRVRTLRDLVAPTLRLPIDAPSGPAPAFTELERRAAAALDGLVRGPLPPVTSADHDAALALTALAHLNGSRFDAALPLMARLTALPRLPPASWGVIAVAARGMATRRAVTRLAQRAARELDRPPIERVHLAFMLEPGARTALLVAALLHGEVGAAEALRTHVEGEALRLRDQGRLEEAIARLQRLEASLGGDRSAARSLDS